MSTSNRLLFYKSLLLPIWLKNTANKFLQNLENKGLVLETPIVKLDIIEVDY